MGIPMVACDCAVCLSDDPRNHRTRTAALIRSETTTILIDPGPDVRIQALRFGIPKLDAVLVTHPHQDHIGGLDDLRAWTLKGGALPLYGTTQSLHRIQHQFDYVFEKEESLSTRPKLELQTIDEAPFTVGDITITPLPVWHGDWLIRGFRVGNVAYVTDVKMIPDSTRPLLEGLDTLVLGALRHTDHPLHFTIAEAVAEVERIKPRQAFFVHTSHDLDYATTNAELPPHVRLAHDGLVIDGRKSF